MPDIKQKTLVNFLLDETGSMIDKVDQTISGFNEYLAGLRQYGKLARVTLTKFNTNKTEVVCANTPVKDVPELTHENYKPDYSTPLYDAIFASIRATEEAIAKAREKLLVLCVILTDGLENASREHTRSEIFDLITKKQKDDGWTFLYLGANQDAWAEGGKIAILGGNTQTFTPDGAGAVHAFAHSMAATQNYFAAARTGDLSHLATVSQTLMKCANTDDIAKYEAKIYKRLNKKGGDSHSGRRNAKSL
jgi:hypothetical protein